MCQPVSEFLLLLTCSRLSCFACFCAKYPNIVPLQAIVGQGAAQAPAQGDQAAAAAAASVAGPSTTPAAAAAGTGQPASTAAAGLLNPMAWLSAPAAAAPASPAGGAANSANI